MKTSRWLSQLGWDRRHRIRAALTSGRSCSAACVVFFIAQTQPVEPVPQRGDPNRDAQSFPAALLEFCQGQISLLGDPPTQGLLMRSKPGAAVTANLLGPAMAGELVLLPEALHALPADSEALANLAGAFAARSRRDDALTQILA